MSSSVFLKIGRLEFGVGICFSSEYECVVAMPCVAQGFGCAAEAGPH